MYIFQELLERHTMLLNSFSNIDEKSAAESFNSRACAVLELAETETTSPASKDVSTDELFHAVLGNKSNSVDNLLRQHSEDGEGDNGNFPETEVSQYGQSMFYSAKDKDNCDGRFKLFFNYFFIYKH